MPKISFNLDAYRSGSERTWDLPTWTHPITQGVFPFCVEVADHLIPIGSCFLISRIGIIVSAAHNAFESFKYHWNGTALRAAKDLPQHYHLSDLSFFVIHHRHVSGGTVEFNLWPITNISLALPTDLLIGFLQDTPLVPRLSSDVSFAVPRVGSKLRCVGFAETRFPSGGIPLARVRDGTFDWQNLVDYKLRVTEGTVTRIFVQRFATRFIEGPCVTIDVDVDHGQSGGPVVNERGQVCGVVSAGASHFFAKPASIVSLLYPSLLSEIKLQAERDGSTVEGCTDILSLCMNGLVNAYGIEEGIAITENEGEYAVNPLINRTDTPFVHDDFRGFQSGVPGTPESGTAWRFSKTEPNDGG